MSYPGKSIGQSILESFEIRMCFLKRGYRVVEFEIALPNQTFQHLGMYPTLSL